MTLMSQETYLLEVYFSFVQKITINFMLKP